MFVNTVYFRDHLVDLPRTNLIKGWRTNEDGMTCLSPNENMGIDQMSITSTSQNQTVPPSDFVNVVIEMFSN